MKPEDDPDVQLMLALQRGDTSAFDRLFQRYAGGVVGFARQFVGSRARAEELAQDVFLQVYRLRRRYVPRARFATWLYRMVTNACFSEVRRADYRGRTTSLDAAAAAGNEPVADADGATDSVEDAVLSRERLDKVQAALNVLPPQQRAALLLTRVEGLSYQEAAQSLSCSVAAVKSLVHRATVTLRDTLGDERS